MQSPSLASRASALIHPDATHVHRTFGNTWRERVGEVRGFRIRTGQLSAGKTFIVEVENLSALAVTHCDRLHAHGHTHYFVLLSDEYVVQVDVYATDAITTEIYNAVLRKTVTTTTTPGQIHALRFRTDVRVSEWFGNCVGEATQFKSPEGSFIQALHGSMTTRVCGQLGVLYAPLAMLPRVEKAADADTYKLTKVFRGREAAELCFRVQHDAPRAFVVSADGNCIRGIDVVSPDQYKAFTELDPTEDAASDHWFILAEGEHVEAIGVDFQNASLSAMRFRTNYRTSMWFGKPTTDATWLDCGEAAGAFICGFQIEGLGETTCVEVTGIAAIYKTTVEVDKTQDVEGEAQGVEEAKKAETVWTDLAPQAFFVGVEDY